mgnify:CR=1 FL=1
MYKVTGEVINAFKSEKTEKYDESFKVQLLGDSPLVDGQVKKEMLTLNVPQPIYDQLKSQIGKVVTVPIGFYVKNNLLVTFYPKHVAGSKGAPSA